MKVEEKVLHRIICNHVADCEEVGRIVKDLLEHKDEWLELEVLERLDVEKVEKTIIEQCVYCKFWDGKGHKLAQAICKAHKEGKLTKEG